MDITRSLNGGVFLEIANLADSERPFETAKKSREHSLTPKQTHPMAKSLTCFKGLLLMHL